MLKYIMEIRFDNFKQKGFTIIELAIVFIVIGLLIGGVLAGQTLIKLAKSNSVITDIKEYQLGAITFRAKYDQFPGDYSLAYNAFGSACDASPENCNGNGNSFIEDTYVINTNQANQNNNEAVRFWQHLSLAQLIKGENTGVGWPYTASPELKYKDVCATVSQGQTTSNALIQVVPPQFTNKNYFVLGSKSRAMSGYFGVPTHCNTPVFSTEEARLIDTKIDDGKPQTGFIANYWGKYGVSEGIEPNCITGFDWDTGIGLQNAEYNLSYTDQFACTLVFTWY